MLDYTGVKCPVCGVPFRKDDDIVVCPECGAPYHRECYQQAGKCVFDNLHAEGKEWEPPAPPKAPDTSAEIKDQECPVCGTLNGHSALFCGRCGASLLGEPQKHSNSPGQTEAPRDPQAPPFSPYGAPRPGNTPFGTAVPPFSFDPMGGVSPADTLGTGVTFGDASKLVKQNTNYYMPVFRYIKQTGRNKFNFSAFLFSGAWMLYRKQYKFGVIITVLMLLLQLVYQCAYWLVCIPTFEALATQAGFDLSAYLTSDQIMTLSMLAAQDPASYFKILLPYLVLGANLIVMIIVGVRGNKMYLKHCVSTVQILKAMEEDGDPNMTLDAKGGVNSMASLCVAICYVVIRMVVPLLI